MNAVLYTSIPKCGTHLLLNYFPRLGYEFAGPFDEILWNDSFIDVVQDLQEGQYCAWHYAWTRELSRIVREKNLCVVFLYRDPRAHIVSKLHFIMGNPEHPAHRYIAGHLKTNHERLIRLIEGIPVDDYRQFFPGEDFVKPIDNTGPTERLPGGINGVYRAFLGWLSDSQCLPVKFEDVIGPRGGGDPARQLETIQRVMDFTGTAKADIDPEIVAASLFDEQAATFRKGTIDSWREDFCEAVNRVFMRESGRLLDVFGYTR